MTRRAAHHAAEPLSGDCLAAVGWRDRLEALTLAFRGKARTERRRALGRNPAASMNDTDDTRQGRRAGCSRLLRRIGDRDRDMLLRNKKAQLCFADHVRAAECLGGSDMQPLSTRACKEHPAAHKQAKIGGTPPPRRLDHAGTEESPSSARGAYAILARCLCKQQTTMHCRFD